MKWFHKFDRSHSDELEKFGTTLMELRYSVWIEVLAKDILLNYMFISDMCVIVIIYFFFHCLLCYLLRTHFLILLFARAYIIVLYSDVRRKFSIDDYNFIFLVYINVCSVNELT